MYLQENQYYLLHNSAVARNPIFPDVVIQQHFKVKMKKYLSPLCDILAYSFKDHEFQILVRLKDRGDFEAYFKEKKGGVEGTYIIPESTYIFSQEMANLQVSLVKKFNIRYNRTGTLMAGRYGRELITSKEKVVELIRELNSGEGVYKHYSGIWADCAMGRVAAMTSSGVYKAMMVVGDEKDGKFWDRFKDDLVGNPNIYLQNSKYLKFLYHHRRLINSIYRNFG